MVIAYKMLKDALLLTERSERDVEHFIEKHPCIWLQALQMVEKNQLKDAVLHINAFEGYSEMDARNE